MRIGRAAATLALAMVIGSCVNDVAPPDVISPPTNVTVTLVGTSSARITWTAPPEAVYVDSYNVYRDDVKIVETTSTSYQDNNLLQGVTYKYRVSANGQLGIPGQLSAETSTSAITIPDITPPVVSSTSPTAGAVGVSRTVDVTAVFSEPMDPATLTTATFFVKAAGGALVPGTVLYDGSTRTARFTVTSQFPNSTIMTATITTGVKDVAGNRLASDFSFSFTTLDNVRPIVVSTSPAGDATGVSVNSAISVTFSEAMDPSSVNAATVLVKLLSSGVAVTGSVSYDATTLTATFVPSTPLAFGARYLITVTVDAKDVAGNTLSGSFASVFSTVSAPDTTAPTVISVLPASGATGVGISTAVGVTFSEAMNASTINASSVLLKLTSNGASVAGTVSYDAVTFTATFAPSAPLSFGTSYTVIVTTDAKDVAGNSLTTGFSSTFSVESAPDTTAPAVISVTPVNGAAGVAVTGSVTVTFSEPMDATTINGSTVTLKNSATLASISATVSYNAATNTTTLTPTSSLSFNTGYTLTVGTGAKDLAGNPLASSFTSTFTTAAAPDITPPRVISTVPANGSEDVGVLTPVTVTFDEPMNPATINTSTIVLKLTSNGVVISGSVSYDGSSNTATFTPSAGTLAYGIGYTLNVSSAADVSGNVMVGVYAATFTTVAAPDFTPPTVTGSSPSTGATGVALSVAPTVTFSEPMNASTISTSTIALRVTSNGVSVPGSVSYNAATNTATFTPSSQLAFATSYTLSVTTGVQDVAGNAMASAFSASFTTVPNPDTTRPTVISFVRLGATGPLLENRSIVSVTFSEAMNPSTINASTVVLYPDVLNAPAVPGTLTYDSNTHTATFTSSSPLAYVASGGPGYVLVVTTDVADLAGNTLASEYDQSMTRVSYFQGTSEELDNTKPHIHMHITFSQSGATLGRAVECQRLPAADCDLLGQNQAGTDAIGAYDDNGGSGPPVAATITALTGTFSNPGITFTITLQNGRTFTFSGTMTNANTITGTLSGATLTSPVAITLAR